jgi:hypothetical protein
VPLRPFDEPLEAEVSLCAMVATLQRWLVVVLMSITLLTIFGLPGCYPHTQTRLQAYSSYRASPTEAARKALADAKRAEWEGVLACEAVLAALLAFWFFLYARVERRLQNEN